MADIVAERLRRSTRNRLGLSRVGSSPASVVLCDCRRENFFYYFPTCFLTNHLNHHILE